MKLRRLSLCGLLVAVSLGTPSVQADLSAPAGTPTATPSTGLSTVGPLFTAGLDQPHSCTAAVLDTPGGDLLITAAHCVVGDGAGMVFAPGYLRGRTPYGVWTVQRAWAMPSWLSDQDPQSDLAVLQVADQPDGSAPGTVQSVTGGLTLGQTALGGVSPRVTTVAYQGGRLDAPVTCTVRLALTEGYPTFNCHGYPDGASGSPFLWSDRGRAPVVIGVIGGLYQGGCSDWNSFSSLLRPSVYALLARAVQDLPADAFPAAGGDDC